MHGGPFGMNSDFGRLVARFAPKRHLAGLAACRLSNGKMVLSELHIYLAGRWLRRGRLQRPVMDLSVHVWYIIYSCLRAHHLLFLRQTQSKADCHSLFYRVVLLSGGTKSSSYLPTRPLR